MYYSTLCIIDEENPSRRILFYTLRPVDDAKTRSVDPIVQSTLTSADDHDLELVEFYKCCMDGMLVGSSLDKAKSVSQKYLYL